LQAHRSFGHALRCQPAESESAERDNDRIRVFLLRQKHIGPKDRAIVHLNGASQMTDIPPVAIRTSSIWFELITCLASGERRELIQELLNYRID